jgi:hypothetical protein
MARRLRNERNAVVKSREDKVKNSNKLASQLAVAAAVAALMGTSAFADSRHHDETRGDSRGGRVERQDRGDRGGNRGGGRQQQFEQRSNQNWDRGRSNDNRGFDRGRSNDNRGFDRGRSNDNRGFDRGRSNDNRGFDNRGNRDWNRDNASRGNVNENWNRGRSENFYRDSNRSFRDGSFGRRGAPSFYNGRIERFERWNGGFRIYLGGAPYPFFVPEAYFRSHGLRIGLSLRLGGYYNPLGYYDYYDGPYYDGAYYGSNYGSGPVTSGDLRGVVESVDYRRGTIVLRDDVSGNFVTTVMRGRDRVLDSLRPGDYVVLSGDWVRGGVFEAYRADLLNDGRDNGYYPR